MTKKQPTDVELQILNVLWRLGKATVREIHVALQASKQTNYATTVKMLSVMYEKGLVDRDQTVRPQVYRALVTKVKMQKTAVRDVARKVFEGSFKGLVLQALSEKKHSRQELDEISRLVDELKQRDSRRSN